MAADPLTKTTVDALFDDNYSDFDADPFDERPVTTTKDVRDDKATLSPRAALKRKFDDGDKENGLGLDEEVKIVKKRKPIAKLDEARLMSEPGIPKLRAITRSDQLSKRLRFKGKGHEFTDAARLLNHFQLWLDNLYPRAKFADALQLVEKAGHTKRMQITRSEWINEGKPGYRRYDDVAAELDQRDEANEPSLFGVSAQEQPRETASGNERPSAAASRTNSANELDGDALFIPDSNHVPATHRDDEPDDDELDALMAEQDVRDSEAPTAKSSEMEEASEGEDDLDALLAEFETSKAKKMSQTSQHTTSRETTKPQHPTDVVIEDDDEDDDLEALLAAQRSRPTNLFKPTQPEEPSLPTPEPTSPPTHEVNAVTPQAAVSSTPIQSPTKSQTPKDGDRAAEPQRLMTPMFSSSPVPNNPEDLDPEDLDALLASQEERQNNA